MFQKTSSAVAGAVPRDSLSGGQGRQHLRAKEGNDQRLPTKNVLQAQIFKIDFFQFHEQFLQKLSSPKQ